MNLHEKLKVMGHSRRYEVMAPRATGRTTRMMEEAIAFAKDGLAVYVVCYSVDHARALEREWIDQKKNLHIQFETPQSMGPGWDWRTLRSADMHSNCVVLVDNWAIEGNFMTMLNMLRRWDEIR
jgi:hypothetical protein